MDDKRTDIATRELWARLFQASTIDQYLVENSDACELPTFAEYITELARSRNEKAERVINRAGIERSFGHRLFSGTRNPSRDTALQLAFGFELTTEETQRLLKIAQLTPLHPKVKRDAVIAYHLHNGLPLMDTQKALHDYGLPLLGGGRRDG